MEKTQTLDNDGSIDSCARYISIETAVHMRGVRRRWPVRMDRTPNVLLSDIHLLCVASDGSGFYRVSIKVVCDY